MNIQFPKVILLNDGRKFKFHHTRYNNHINNVEAAYVNNYETLYAFQDEVGFIGYFEPDEKYPGLCSGDPIEIDINGVEYKPT